MKSREAHRETGFLAEPQSGAQRIAEDAHAGLRRSPLLRSLLIGPEAVVIIDSRARVISANRQFTEVFGYTASEMAGQNPMILQEQPELIDEMKPHLLDPARGTWSGAIAARARDGRELWVALTVTTLRDERAALLGFVARIRDDTERKRHDDELARKNAELVRLNEFKSDLIASTAHDLKAPIDAIVRVASALSARAESASREEFASELSRISTEGRRLLRIVDETLDLQRAEAGALRLCRQPVRLDAIARDVAARLDAGAPGRIHVEADPTSSYVAIADPDRIEQTLENLVSNAHKYAPPGTRIDIVCRATVSHVALDVCDRGPGIPPQEREAIFARFHQIGGSRPRGAGMGLCIVKHLVNLHGGQVSVADREGGGCVLRVALPRRLPSDPSICTTALILGGRPREVSDFRKAFEGAGVRVFESLGRAEAARRLFIGAPGAIVLFEDAMSPEAVTAAQRLRSELGTLVAVVRDAPPNASATPGSPATPGEEPFDHELVRPVLGVELTPLLLKIGGPKRLVSGIVPRPESGK